MRCLIDLTHGIRLSHHLIKLNCESKEDLNVWLTFLAKYNGRSFFIEERWANPQQLNLFTNAAGGVGFGAIFGSEYCHGLWPDSWQHQNIAILEFYPIVLSLCLWGHRMANRSVLFFTDNKALVYVINKQSCKDKTLMQFVRKLVLVCLQNNILFKAKHITGTYNRLADLLSRFQVPTFKREAPASMHSCATGTSLQFCCHKIGRYYFPLNPVTSLQQSPLATYRRAWKVFDQFYINVFDTVSYTLPISPHTLAFFIAYMFDRDYAPATVSTYVSAIGYSHKLLHLVDPTKVFYIIQMLKGYGKLGFRIDSRLPITLPILT